MAPESSQLLLKFKSLIITFSQYYTVNKEGVSFRVSNMKLFVIFSPLIYTSSSLFKFKNGENLS